MNACSLNCRCDNEISELSAEMPDCLLFVTTQSVVVTWFICPACLPQVFKFIYACRLAEMGLAAQAFHYCEVISRTVLKDPHYYSPVLIGQLIQVTGGRIECLWLDIVGGKLWLMNSHFAMVLFLRCRPSCACLTLR